MAKNLSESSQWLFVGGGLRPKVKDPHFPGISRGIPKRMDCFLGPAPLVTQIMSSSAVALRLGEVHLRMGRLELLQHVVLLLLAG